MVKIAPSILAADFEHLEEEIKSVEEAGADYIHVDVMDGVFVPNKTPGLEMLKRTKMITKLTIDTHLMVEKPGEWIDDFSDSNILTFHIEAVSREECLRLIQVIHDKGIKVGISIKPNTPVKEVYPFLSLIDMVLVMTVEPGFGGQKLIGKCLRKVKAIRRKNSLIDIEVDGGIGDNNIQKVKRAGANVIVAGTAIFGSNNRKETINNFRNQE